MSLSVFLRALFDHGRVQVAAPTEKITRQDEREAEVALREQDSAARLEGPGKLPELNLAVALWAAKTCYGACQLIVFRQLDEQTIGELLPTDIPPSEPPSRHCSRRWWWERSALPLRPDLHPFRFPGGPGYPRSSLTYCC